MRQPFAAKLARSYLRSMPWIAANRQNEDARPMLMIGENCRRPNLTIVEFWGGTLTLPNGPVLLAHGITVDFERGAAAAEIDAVAEELLTAERKPDTHRVLKRPSEASGVMLTVTVSPHRRIEHRS
jgi:hypothetical protein